MDLDFSLFSFSLFFGCFLIFLLLHWLLLPPSYFGAPGWWRFWFCATWCLGFSFGFGGCLCSCVLVFLCCFGWLVLFCVCWLLCVGVGCVFVFFFFEKHLPLFGRCLVGWFVWFTFVCCSCSPVFGRVRLGCFLGGFSLSPFLLGTPSLGPPLLCCWLVPLSPLFFCPGRRGRRRVALSSVRLWLPRSCRLFSTRLVLGRIGLGCFVVSLGIPRRLCLLGVLGSFRRLVFCVFVSPRRVRVRVAPPWSVAIWRLPRLVLLVSSLVCSLPLIQLVRRRLVFVLLFGCLALVFLLWLSPHLVLPCFGFVFFSSWFVLLCSRRVARLLPSPLRCWGSFPLFCLYLIFFVCFL